MKQALTILLVLTAFGGIAAALYRQSPARADGDSVPGETVVAADASLQNPAHSGNDERLRDVVTVTYFTTNARCPSCLKIEELARRAVETRFAEQLGEGRLEFRIINVDQPGNRHFIDDYQLVSKSVVVAKTLNGREESWVNLQDIWLLLGNEQALMDYVAQAVDAYL